MRKSCVNGLVHKRWSAGYDLVESVFHVYTGPCICFQAEYTYMSQQKCHCPCHRSRFSPSLTVSWKNMIQFSMQIANSGSLFIKLQNVSKCEILRSFNKILNVKSLCRFEIHATEKSVKSQGDRENASTNLFYIEVFISTASLVGCMSNQGSIGSQFVNPVSIGQLLTQFGLLWCLDLMYPIMAWLIKFQNWFFQIVSFIQPQWHFGICCFNFGALVQGSDFKSECDKLSSAIMTLSYRCAMTFRCLHLRCTSKYSIGGCGVHLLK